MAEVRAISRPLAPERQCRNATTATDTTTTAAAAIRAETASGRRLHAAGIGSRVVSIANVGIPSAADSDSTCSAADAKRSAGLR